MKYSLSLKIGEWLYKNAFFIYQPIYFFYKNQNEKIENELIKQLVKKNDVVVDIGANIGFYTQLFSNLVGDNGKVFAFEPDKKNFERLLKNTKNHSNIIIENKAISNHSGIIKLYHSELNVDHRTYPSSDALQSYEVECITLDEYFNNQNLAINFIKIDIQGYEYFALLGMKNILEKNKHLILFSEFWPYGLQQAGTSAKDYFLLLQNYFPKISIIENENIKELTLEHISKLPVSIHHYYNIIAEK